MRWIKNFWDHYCYGSLWCFFFGHDRWVSLHLKDDGRGNLIGTGGHGKMDYKTGEVDINASPSPCRRCGWETRKEIHVEINKVIEPNA